MTAADIAHALGGARKEGRDWRCRCPLHGGRSLVLREGNGGSVLLTCWGGCNRLDVLAELRRLGLLYAHPTRYQSPAVAPPPHDEETRRIACARRIWDDARDPLGSPVVLYLASRGITMTPPASLRWAPRCWHREVQEYLPAMVALVEHVERGMVGIHRTYLTSDLCRRDRASLGPIGGGAVRLGAPRAGEWLAIAEGIETALAVVTAYEMPAWAALAEGGIRSLVLPPDATHVIICADHDVSGVGQRAAHEAAGRWLAEGRRVRIAMPPEPDTDWNDVLSGKTSAEMRRASRVA
jgi:putative DNA primase/helicase